MFIMAVKEPKVVSLDNHLRFWAIISMCIWQLKSQKLSAAAVQSTNLDKGSKVEVASGSYIHL